MTQQFVCPSCHSSVVSDATARRAKCRACGEVFDLPAQPSKTCVGCGIDVSHQKRTKDAQGNYYCDPCWQAQIGVTQKQQAANGSADYGCSVCRRLFPVEQVYEQDGAFICHECFAAQANTPAQSQPGHPAAPPQPVYRYPCSSCQGTFTLDRLYDQGGTYICQSCYAMTLQTPAQASHYQPPISGRGRLTSRYKKQSSPAMKVVGIIVVVIGGMIGGQFGGKLYDVIYRYWTGHDLGNGTVHGGENPAAAREALVSRLDEWKRDGSVAHSLLPKRLASKYTDLRLQEYEVIDCATKENWYYATVHLKVTGHPFFDPDDPARADVNLDFTDTAHYQIFDPTDTNKDWAIYYLSE